MSFNWKCPVWSFFKGPFPLEHISQIHGLFCVWMRKCSFRCLFSERVLEHTLQINGLSQVGIQRCLFRLLLSENDLRQTSQLNGLSSIWIFKGLFNIPLTEKLLEHTSQLQGFLVCVCSCFKDILNDFSIRVYTDSKKFVSTKMHLKFLICMLSAHQPWYWSIILLSLLKYWVEQNMVFHIKKHSRTFLQNRQLFYIKHFLKKEDINMQYNFFVIV